MKKGALFCLKGIIREPKPTNKGIRVLLGILVLYPQKDTQGIHSPILKRNLVSTHHKQ